MSFIDRQSFNVQMSRCDNTNDRLRLVRKEITRLSRDNHAVRAALVQGEYAGLSGEETLCLALVGVVHMLEEYIERDVERANLRMTPLVVPKSKEGL